MIVVVLCLLAVASVPLTGGDLSRVRGISLRHGWAPVAAVLAQTLAVDGPVSTMAVVPWALHALSYVVAVWFLWINRTVPGLGLIGAGGIANLAAITANGGVMPATPWAVAVAGRATDAGFANSAPSTGSPLWFLGDVFAIPAGWPLANVFSIGDVVLVIGLATMLHRLSRRDAAAPAELSAAPVG